MKMALRMPRWLELAFAIIHLHGLGQAAIATDFVTRLDLLKHLFEAQVDSNGAINELTYTLVVREVAP